MPLAVTPCLVMCVRQAKQQWCCGGGSRLLVLFPFGVAHELVELFVEVLVTGMAPQSRFARLSSTVSGEYDHPLCRCQ